MLNASCFSTEASPSINLIQALGDAQHVLRMKHMLTI